MTFHVISVQHGPPRHIREHRTGSGDGAGRPRWRRQNDAYPADRRPVRPHSGRITVCGFDSVKDAEAIHGVVGYMPQRFGLYEDLTVAENLNLHADLRAVVGRERAQVFERLLGFTGLAPFTKRLAGALSGGMKQKLGLACTLIRPPRLLLLDEPSVGVDPLSRRELWRMVHELVDRESACSWCTAYLDEAERCGGRRLLNEGSCSTPAIQGR